jgi:UDP-N-acetylglucosamine 4,6-dehydratase/5-epimerase
MKNQILLITGGTGSFGNAVLSHFLNTELIEIRIFSRDEKKQEDMRIHFNNEKLKFYIGDVRDYSSVYSAMINVDYVFHAAALKQVPSCEFYPMEAVKTNIIGTENILDAAIKLKTKNVVVLSTDKAVYPINAMGISKAMMEKLMVAKSRILEKDQIFSATRYGNVMASRGSVIPLFISQIKSGNPLTITDPNMTRFMMDLGESVDLVKFAFTNAEAGDIFVQKAKSATIIDLAKALLQIFNANNEIKIIGTRHSEKLYETLLTQEEMQNAIDMGQYYRIPADNRNLNYDQYVSEGEVSPENLEDYHSHNTERLENDELIKVLLGLDFVQQELKNNA